MSLYEVPQLLNARGWFQRAVARSLTPALRGVAALGRPGSRPPGYSVFIDCAKTSVTIGRQVRIFLVGGPRLRS